MAANVYEKFDQGLSPDEFVNSMTKNKEEFQKWYDSFTWGSDEQEQFFQSLSFRDDLRCLIIAADWCGDVVRNVPAVFRALEPTEMPVEVLKIEEHTDLIDQFLTFGARSIPKVIFADTGGHVLGHWGPRPAYVQEPMAAFKKEYTDPNAEGYEEAKKEVYAQIKERYGDDADYQRLIVEELKELLSGV